MAKNTPQPNSTRSADITVLKNPRVTEKTARANAQSVYVFDIAPRVTKSEIAKAFARVYKHKPVKIRLVNIPPKSVFRRTAQGSQLGFGAKVRKAYIYLPKGTTIEVL